MNAHTDPGSSSCERLARTWVRQAARRSPPALAERLEEEWLADLAVQHGAFAQLRFAAGCWWARSVIAHEHLALEAPAMGPPAVVSGPPRLSSGPLSPRTVFIAVIVGLHGLVIYGFIAGLGGRLIPHVGPTTSKVTWIDEHTPRSPPVTVQSQGTLRDPRTVDFPLPPIDLQFPPDDAGLRDAVVDGGTTSDLRTSPPLPPPVRVTGGPGAGFPSTEEFYPSASRRLVETGATTVRVCVDEQGRLASAPTLVQSSGSSRLDEGALQLAKAGSGHYRSSTADGRPVSDCFPFRIRFALK